MRFNQIIYKRIYVYLALSAVLVFSACKKQLNLTPQSQITPEEFFTEQSQLGAYAIARYNSILPSHSNWSFGTFGIDANTDNMAVPDLSSRFLPGQWRVGSDGGAWSFGNIRQLNYFLAQVLPKWSAGKIVGSSATINQYIGEIYFLRAYEYFNKLQALGDFPILRGVLPDDLSLLTKASERRPCNEVARFILSDLDSAATLLQPGPVGNKNRISRECAQLLKSRVGLFEGTWLKYFKGTAFVPNGNNWPGKSKSYNANYQFPSGSIDGEIQFFLSESMKAAQLVASKIPLVTNTGIIEAPNNENPYFNMFSAVDMSGYSEVLLWRQYAPAIATHNVPVYAMAGNDAVGLTRSMVESYVMSNGLPIYASGSGYKGDDYISDVRTNRDGRLVLFLKEPGQKNVLVNASAGDHVTAVEPIPAIYLSSVEQKYTTGYAIRKGLNYDGTQARNGSGYTGCVIFRATEAYLNYIEACYELNGTIDGNAANYWQQIRTRAQVDPNYQKTIAATDMSKETLDMGAYSAGSLISPTLYNIRRERRCELMGEGLRYMDLIRWRAMDQLISQPYHFEGFKLWGPMKSWYTPSQIIYGATDPKATVSDPALSAYLRPHEIRSSALSYNGAKWIMAHYLNPIAAQHFIISSNNGDTPIYQNPGWPVQAGGVPQ
ncbi:RagB/SusD family nutrient uptake outer membrane protein [Mucilaginibacter sp. RS28]|uniref:RagB/SusD family nutrient uptake outer membrane protein n=1 Tax=Mucilaginibacter straminoryzae TaxID=2932774 RepID=A0A9X1X3P1_9SPHI|nr:RagB/SusD family nutrient uptake outer membrane protein [Mucilaginibacter straminoryzae]MCJ8209735.1 RagB/SusD family nutrient uptake outer membrane protein [Mucilaginibacter straminoryzae]